MPMTTDDDYHPDLQRIARFLPRAMFVPAAVPALRLISQATGRARPRHGDVDRLASGVRVRIHRPASSGTGQAALLWIHGGGYVMGSAAQDDGVCAGFARDLGITVLSVDYRLAPKHPYPAGLEDCYAALTYLAGLPEVDPARIAIGGASAGGGLAAALALLARDRAEIRPAFQLLVYPMVDAPGTPAPAADPRFRIWNHATNAYAWRAYLGGADAGEVAPARRADLAGLPPAWVGVGTLDPLHDEGVAYAQRLRAADVACDLTTVPGAFHGFDRVVAGARVSRDFLREQKAVLRKALHDG